VEGARLVIPGHKIKGHQEHRVPLVPEAVELLRSLPRALRAALAALGEVTADWGLHDIRRTARTEMGDLGVEPWIAERCLAHARKKH
jgi:integrase